jgi:ABC-type antimicrobial peptide transport system permease subunit
VTSYQLYQPMAQESRAYNEIAVRAAGLPPSVLVDSIRTSMMSLDQDLPVRKLQPAATTIARANYQAGVLASVLSALAILGLGLASLGVYGVIARTVAQRTGEFGIRIALGAQARDITRLVLTSGAKLAAVGCALGLVGAVGICRLLTAAFPGIQASSIPILIAATVLLIAIAQIAGYLPARYASRVSPTEALRAE